VNDSQQLDQHGDSAVNLDEDGFSQLTYPNDEGAYQGKTFDNGASHSA